MMSITNRKQFITNAAILLAAIATSSSFKRKNKSLLLSFSTLGCPDWNFQQIIDFAALHGYEGIELRGILRQMDLTKCPELSDIQSISATLTRLKEKNLQIVDLGSSANMHIADPVKRKENMDEAKQFIDLAQKMGCPFIRVFPNNLPKDQEKQTTLQLIIDGLKELGNYAKGTSVTVLMETHGDLVYSDDIEKVMQSVDHQQTGLIWDIANMWTVTKEPPALVYSKLKKYIHHTHIKDAKLVNGEPHYVLLGLGEVPIFEAIDLLQKEKYKGFYSFEWEKLWHPELAEPELALADYPSAIKKHIGI